MSYKTTIKAFDLLREAIAEELSKCDDILKGEIELDESYFSGKRKGKRGRGAAGKTIVFGILERGGKVSVEIVKNVTAETLMSETVKKVRRGSIVYTDKWKGYDFLMFRDTSILISITDINSKKEKSSLMALRDSGASLRNG